MIILVFFWVAIPALGLAFFLSSPWEDPRKFFSKDGDIDWCPVFNTPQLCLGRFFSNYWNQYIPMDRGGSPKTKMRDPDSPHLLRWILILFAANHKIGSMHGQIPCETIRYIVGTTRVDTASHGKTAMIFWRSVGEFSGGLDIKFHHKRPPNPTPPPKICDIHHIPKTMSKIMFFWGGTKDSKTLTVSIQATGHEWTGRRRRTNL